MVGAEAKVAVMRGANRSFLGPLCSFLLWDLQHLSRGSEHRIGYAKLHREKLTLKARPHLLQWQRPNLCLTRQQARDSDPALVHLG